MGFTLYHTGMLPGLPAKLVFEQDGIAIGDLLQLLSNRYGEGVVRDVLDQEGQIAEGALVVLNGSIIRPHQALSTLIPPRSELLLTVLIAGG